jgi:putative transposase
LEFSTFAALAEGDSMKRSKFNEAQIPYFAAGGRPGTPVGDVCRKVGIAEATFYIGARNMPG